ncbi:TonB-dependent receptor [Mucilaginibacter sp. dw_454]|uniref:TonB-dependent receptor n=1 Tax=Mucilaginibacter sp. dw_454 TaxID=2720079 RepID=UPI001BD30C64|nr:TonB-dependent receptor [Mucilaginibacter sp. dw_454]
MKQFVYLALLLIFIQPLRGFTQNQTLASPGFTQTIKGIVTDKSTKLAMPGVTVKISSVDPIKASTTNVEGVYKISDVPVGRHILEVSYPGYQTVVLTEVLVTTGKETEVNVELEPQSKQLHEVSVGAGRDKRPVNNMALSSARSFSPEETNRYAGGFFDPARMAQSFAGVVAGGDNNEIVVRGNSPKSLQWRLEGIEIINPNHFSNAGAAGGSISMLNSALLSTSDFYTGAMPAEYSNATSGVFDLKFRKGNTDKNETSLSIGLLGAGITTEGPFKKGGSASYLISYRYSSLDLLQKTGLLGSDGVPKYQDLSFNFVFPTQSAGTFSIFGIGGLSSVDVNAKHDFTKWKERSDGDDFLSKYGAGSAGLKHVYIANSKLYLTNIISYSRDQSRELSDTLTHAYQPSTVQNATYINSTIRYAGTLNYHATDASNIRVGINASYLNYNLYDQEYKQETRSLQQLLNQSGNAHTFDAFIEDKYDFDNGLTLNAGAHTNYFSLSNSWSFEPCLGLNYQLGNTQNLSLAAGAYSRLESLSYYFATLPNSSVVTNSGLRPTKSEQAVIGYEKFFSGHLKFKTEVYYQHLYDVPVSSDPNSNFSLLNVLDDTGIGAADYTSLVNKGTGKNYGIEFSLEKSLSKGYYFMATTSLFDSKFKSLSGQEFHTTFDSHVVVNAVAGKEWAVSKDKKNLFGLNGKVILAGGRKYSPINLAESLRLDEQVIDETKINTLTADPYIRVDFSASYRINGKKVAHYLLLDIQNLLNRQNNTGLFYNPSKRIVEKDKWIGILPVLTYRIDF